jgi:ketosteroid isomerase-like protein
MSEHHPADLVLGDALFRTDAARALVQRVVLADQALDAAAFVNVLNPGARFRIGGSPWVVGRDAVRESIARFFGLIDRLRHRIDTVWREDERAIIYEAVVTYDLAARPEPLELPYCNVLRLEDGLVSDYRIYVDLTQLRP